MFSAQAGPLAAAFAAASKAIENRNVIPILGNLLVSAGTGVVTVSGTNLNHRIASPCKADVTEPLDVTVEARMASWLSALDPEAIVKCTLVGDKLHSRAGRSNARLETLPASDFPIFTGPDQAIELSLSADQCTALFSTPRPAVSDEETRYYLCGIHLKAAGDTLTATATNGRILITKTISLPSAADIVALRDGVIVPTKACAVISKMSGAIQVDRVSIVATDPTQTYSSKLIEGTFPDYVRVIPPDSKCFAKVDRKEFIAATQRLQALGTPKVAETIRIEWGDGGMRLSLRDAEAGAEELEAETNGLGKTAANSVYVNDILEVIAGPSVKIEVSDPGTPLKITCADDLGLIAVVMPIRI